MVPSDLKIRSVSAHGNFNHWDSIREEENQEEGKPPDYIMGVARLRDFQQT